MGFCHVGGVLQGILVGGDGQVKLALAFVGHAQVDHGKDKAWIDFEGAFVKADGFGQVAQFLEDDAQVVKQVGALGVEDDGALQQGQGLGGGA